MMDFDNTILEIFADKGVDCRSHLFRGTISNTQAIQIAHMIREQVLHPKEFKASVADHGTITLFVK